MVDAQSVEILKQHGHPRQDKLQGRSRTEAAIRTGSPQCLGVQNRVSPGLPGGVAAARGSAHQVTRQKKRAPSPAVAMGKPDLHVPVEPQPEPARHRAQVLVLQVQQELPQAVARNRRALPMKNLPDTVPAGTCFSGTRGIETPVTPGRIRIADTPAPPVFRAPARGKGREHTFALEPVDPGGPTLKHKLTEPRHELAEELRLCAQLGAGTVKHLFGCRPRRAAAYPVRQATGRGRYGRPVFVLHQPLQPFVPRQACC